MHDSFILFGLFLLFMGFGLLIYMQLLGLLMRFHIRLFPLIAERIYRKELLLLYDDSTTNSTPSEVSK
jgi:hypothetical protein